MHCALSIALIGHARTLRSGYWIGVLQHPALVELRSQQVAVPRWKFSIALKHVVYRSNVQSSSYSLHPESYFHDDVVNKDTKVALKSKAELDGPPPQKIFSFEAVQRHAMLEHFRQIADMSCVYSVPTELVTVTSLDQGIHKPLRKRRRRSVAVSHGGFIHDVDDGEGGGDHADS